MGRLAGRKSGTVAADKSGRRLGQLLVEKKRELDLLRSTFLCEVSRHYGDGSSPPWASNFVRYFECANGAANRAIASGNPSRHMFPSAALAPGHAAIELSEICNMILRLSISLNVPLPHEIDVDGPRSRVRVGRFGFGRSRAALDQGDDISTVLVAGSVAASSGVVESQWVPVSPEISSRFRVAADLLAENARVLLAAIGTSSVVESEDSVGGTIAALLSPRVPPALERHENVLMVPETWRWMSDVADAASVPADETRGLTASHTLRASPRVPRVADSWVLS
jgi:hypothetical protein